MGYRVTTVTQTYRKGGHGVFSMRTTLTAIAGKLRSLWTARVMLAEWTAWALSMNRACSVRESCVAPCVNHAWSLREPCVVTGGSMRGICGAAAAHQWDISGKSVEHLRTSAWTPVRRLSVHNVGQKSDAQRLRRGHWLVTVATMTRPQLWKLGGPRDGRVGHVIMVGEHAERAARIGKRNGVAARCRLRQATAEKRR